MNIGYIFFDIGNKFLIDFFQAAVKRVQHGIAKLAHYAETDNDKAVLIYGKQLEPAD